MRGLIDILGSRSKGYSGLVEPSAWQGCLDEGGRSSEAAVWVRFVWIRMAHGDDANPTKDCERKVHDEWSACCPAMSAPLAELVNLPCTRDGVQSESDSKTLPPHAPICETI